MTDADLIAGVLFNGLSNANYRIRKVLEGQIQALEYDGANVVKILMANGQTVNVTVTQEKKQ